MSSGSKDISNFECNTFKQLVGLLSDKPNSSNTNKDKYFFLCIFFFASLKIFFIDSGVFDWLNIFSFIILKIFLIDSGSID